MDNTEVIKILKSFLESELADGDKVAIYEQDLEAFNIAIEALKNQEAEKEKWIPISERLPEKDVEVLATTEWGEVTIAERYDANGWYILEGSANADTDDLIAWMELPKPYKEESEE